jgi:hypothetical protein
MVFQRRDVSLSYAFRQSDWSQELYEPLWEDLHSRSKQHGFRIRGIWIADLANQGASGILNEQLLGNDRMSHPTS